MPRKYYVFGSVPVFTAKMAHDSGWSGISSSGSDPQGRQGQIFDVPDGVPDGNGAQLNLTAEGKNEIQIRGVLKTVPDDPTRCYLQVDDFFFTDASVPIAPPVTLPPGSQKPLDYINAVYNTGLYNLSTKQGCGTFTEACCNELAKNLGLQWGHVAKSPGQNQWNNHAVDALMCLSGEYDGIWDIIYSSVSSSAKPVFNRAGDINPSIWRPAQPIPVEPVGAKASKAIDDSSDREIGDKELGKQESNFKKAVLASEAKEKKSEK